MKCRQEYIDIAKGIGILLVVIGHLQLPITIRNIIYSFHMPLFFYLGGILYKNKNSIPWKKIQYLLFLYLIFGCFFISIIMLQKRYFDINLLYYFIQSNPVSIYNIKWFGVFWFILAYVLVLILQKIKIFSYIVINISIMAGLYYIQNTNIFDYILYLPLCIAPSMILLFFFNIGKSNDILLKFYSFGTITIVAVGFAILNICNMYFYNGFELKIINYGVLTFIPNFISTVLVALFGIAFIVYFSLFLSLKTNLISKCLQFFGKNSLSIFIWHMFLLSLLNLILKRFFIETQDYNPILIEFLKFALVLLICFLFLFLYEKIKRIFIGKMYFM
ncbi:acyltransferase family protein [Campylobacter sp. MOP51]|uniref:acyltransferase family protein n=1 Tax=Campylobacter canis TaxID=3378588 RepID=UPI003C5D4228